METIDLNRLSAQVYSIQQAKKRNDQDEIDRRKAIIEQMIEALPHGSGLDNGVKFCLERSTDSKLIFSTSFHHMNEVGYYTGWTEHKIVLTPKFGDYRMRITGINKNNIKEHLADIFSETFTIR